MYEVWNTQIEHNYKLKVFSNRRQSGAKIKSVNKAGFCLI